MRRMDWKDGSQAMIVRYTKYALLAVVVLYLGALAGLVAFQRSFIFDPRDTGGKLHESRALAIDGSQRVTIETSDGEKLAGWYAAPSTPDGDVFLFFHGKGGGLEKKTARWDHIREHGSGVLAFSYRGFPGSTGEPSEAGLYEDARAAYRWLREKHAAEHIVLHGLSLGTGVAAKLATEVDARALVLEAPYTALVDVAQGRQPLFPVSLLLLDQFRTKDFIANVRMPLLIVHGDQDRSIPVEQAKELFGLAPEPKSLIVMDGSGHETLVRDGIYPRIWEFLSGL